MGETVKERFRVADYIAKSKIGEADKSVFSKDKNDRSFKEVIDFFDRENERKLKAMDDEEKLKLIELQHNAVIGDPMAIAYIKDQINEFLHCFNLIHNPFPDYYETLNNAIFQERYGLGPLYVWSKIPDSQSAQIIGTDIYITYPNGDKKLIDIKYQCLEKVYELCEMLTMKDSKARINEQDPTLEIDLYDGTRVTIVIPPWTMYPILTFRRHVVTDFSFEFQARKETIPEEAIKILRSLARTKTNNVFSGPVRSAKSTMLKTFFAERNEKDTVIGIEKSNFELYLRRDFPKRAVIEFCVDEEDLLEKVFPVTLRQDVSYYIVAEMRSIEAEIYLKGGERGSRGCMGTYHTTQAVNIPGLLARHVVDAFPSRSYRQELIRAAEVIDYVFLMQEMEDGYSKKLLSVEEVVLDPFTHEVSTVTIMAYNSETCMWEYNNHIDPLLFKKMELQNRGAARAFKYELEALAKRRPLIKDAKVVSLESKGGFG